MTRPGGSSGWGSPQIVVATLSLIMAVIGSYLAIQRDGNEDMMRQINSNARDIAVLISRVNNLEREKDRRE